MLSLKLTTVHQILIGGAILLGGLFALRSVLSFTRGGSVRELALGLLSALAAAAAALYLRAFRRKLHGGGHG